MPWSKTADPLQAARALLDEAKSTRGPWRRTVLAGARRYLEQARLAVDDTRRGEAERLAARLDEEEHE